MSLEPGSVWLDARGTQSAAHGERGVARYVAEHARSLLEAAPGLVGSIGLDPSVQVPPSMRPLIGSGALRWHHRLRPDGPQPSIYHVMSPFEFSMEIEDIWPAWARERDCRLVVTLYDLIPLVMREDYLTEEVWGHMGTVWQARLGLIRSAHQVLTISTRTAEDAVERLGIPQERLTVIDSGVSAHHSSLVSSSAEAEHLVTEERPAIRPGFLLYVGGDDARKNMEGTIRAYARLPEELRAAHQLVIVCRIGLLRRTELRVFGRSLGLRPGELVLTGFVDDRMLAALYRTCELFIFPSLYEGAGLPILEAMTCGAPVAASNTSSIPELLGDLEGTFDPADPGDIAACVQRVLESPELLASLRRRSQERVALYTWRRVAERTLDGYERALALPLERPRGARRGRSGAKRLAVVSPWPPETSPAAAYGARLVEALSEHAEVDLIAGAHTPGNGASREGAPDLGISVRTTAEFDWLRELRGYDGCLQVLGSSPSHLHVLEAILEVPGVVLADDVGLLELYIEFHRHRHLYDPYWLEDKLVEMYGDRMPPGALRLIPQDDPLVKQPVTMTPEVQSHARRILVHSAYQAEILRLERPANAAPVEVIPRAIPDAPSSNGGGDRPEGPVVVVPDATGVGQPLLEGFAQLAADRPGALLIVLGELADQERASFEQLASRLGVAGWIELRGRVDDDAHWRALRSADVAVRLSSASDRGEASEAVCDCIAARVPTVVREGGWERELPEPAVFTVPVECTAGLLAERLGAILDRPELADRARAAQESYAGANSFARVAERYLEILSL
jgi:glycosyltransferase involved in cell wall biosynthesis